MKFNLGGKKKTQSKAPAGAAPGSDREGTAGAQGAAAEGQNSGQSEKEKAIDEARKKNPILGSRSGLFGARDEGAGKGKKEKRRGGRSRRKRDVPSAKDAQEQEGKKKRTSMTPESMEKRFQKMADDMNLTPRDEMLLYVLGIVVIAALFFLLVFRPVWTSISEKNASIETEQATHDTMAMKRMKLPGVQSLIGKASEDVTQMSSKYYDLMSSAQIDNLFTHYVLGFGLTSVDLTITMPQAKTDMVPYSDSVAMAKLAQQAASSSTAQESGTGDTAGTGTTGPLVESSGAEATSTDAAGVYTATVTMVVSGSEEKGQEMINDLQDPKRTQLRLVSYSWGESDVTSDENGNLTAVNGSRELTVTVEVYMYDPETDQAKAAAPAAQSSAAEGATN